MNELRKYSDTQLIEELVSRKSTHMLKTLLPGEGVFVYGSESDTNFPAGTIIVAIVPDQKRG